jgi:predicted NBD/HSP70 family sugar kinase
MSMPSAVRHINEVRILDALYRQGTTTRADLARELGLMRSTVGNLVVGLIEQGLVSETEVTGAVPAGRTGRPGQQVRLHAGHAAFIGADIGVGHLSVVALDLQGQLVCSRTTAFEPRHGDFDTVLDALVGLIRSVMGALPAQQTVQGLCVTAPGLVNRAGVVLRAPGLGWQSVPLQSLLADRLGWTGTLLTENDANAFAATALFGRSPQASADALFVYMDAGVGGGLASQGKLHRGHRGYAGEIGHMLIGARGFDPRTAIEGSFESHVSRTAVLARHRHHGGASNDLADFLSAAAAQEPAARQTLSEWAWWLGRGLASLISVLDPGRIVLGGPVSVLHAQVECEVVASIVQHSVQPSAPPPAIEVCALGAQACAIGAALMLHHAHLSFDERIVYGGATAEP